MWNDFMPCTKPVYIGNDIYYRPHKHWGANVWAGEGLFINSGDRSGCLQGNESNAFLSTCRRPIVVFQRIYWKGDKQISAVLSYPNGLSIHPDYFWEIYPANDDIERFFGENAEQEMEEKIKEILK